MPSVTRDEVSLVPSPASKKRRRDNDNENSYSNISVDQGLHGMAAIGHSNLGNATNHYQGGGGGAGLTARKILPLTSAAKKQRLIGATDARDCSARPPATIPRPAPLPMTASQYKRNQCHICGRRPMVLSDLDAYADCQGCGNRTCYVCIRQCLGWAEGSFCQSKKRGAAPVPDKAMEDEAPDDAPDEAQHAKHGRQNETSGVYVKANETSYEPETTWLGGHHEVICSRCCIEKGADGDVVCLGCLPYA